MDQKVNPKYNIIDLFCGCGGFSKGFEQAGFCVKIGVDSWPDAANTYSKNFPSTKVVTADINGIQSKDVLKQGKVKKSDIDVIIGGPPCQGFSISGKRMIDDPRNILYKRFVQFVSDIEPKIFVMENVPGLIRLFDGAVKDEVIHDFSSIGYNVDFRILSADTFGVPQQRKRVFFVGLSKKVFGDNVFFVFPLVTHGKELKPIVTSKEAISDLDFIPDDVILDESIDYLLPPSSPYQTLMRKNSKKIWNHNIVLHTKKTKSIIALVPDGGNYKDLPKNLWNTRKVHIAWTRLNSNKPSFTIDTGHNHHFHYSKNRVPTVRESARLQSFPDSFVFYGKKPSQLKQVGNAVPPLLAEAIAQQIKKTIKEKLCIDRNDSISAQ